MPKIWDNNSGRAEMNVLAAGGRMITPPNLAKSVGRNQRLCGRIDKRNHCVSLSGKHLLFNSALPTVHAAAFMLNMGGYLQIPFTAYG
jgi:hypothetical protein